MRKSQKVLVKISETRQRVNQLMAKQAGELTDEERAALDTDTESLFAMESEYRTAVAEEAAADVIADGQRARDGEGAEMRTLQGRVRVGRYVRAAVEDRRVDGAEAEFNEARGMADNGIVQLPFELLAPAEQRADAPVAIGAGTSDPITPGRWLGRLFEIMRAGYIGVTMDSVAAGSLQHYVLGGANAALQRGRGEAQDAVTATVTAVEMKPKRMAARYVYRVEDTAQIDRLEAGLTRDLQMVMATGMDRKIFSGDAGANADAGDIKGILQDVNVTALNVAGTTIAATGVVIAAFINVLAGLIDGIRAGSPADINMLVGLGLNKELLTRLYIATEVDSFGEVLKRRGFSYETLTTDQLGAATNATPVQDDQLIAVVSLANYLEGAAVAAVWPAVSLIRDPYTGAATGEVALTATALWDFKVIRSGHFIKIAAGV